MKQTLSFILVFLCLGIAGYAQDSLSLRFSSEGEFKIVQFTDTHYKWGKKASNVAIECMEEVLDAEKPDFVIMTGDQVYSSSVAKSLPALLKCISDRHIPFVTIFGNHDAQFDCTRPEMYDLVRSLPYNIQPDRGGVDSPDYVLSVQSSDGTHKSAIFYCMDSHGPTKMKGVGKYDWLTFDQINWYRKNSKEFTEENGGVPLPSVAFLHIPLPEYGMAEVEEENVLIGSKGEEVSSPKLNSGMFTAIKEQGDVMAVFCGHDHDNDFAVIYKDILLAYGRYTGGNTVYNHIGLNGGRVILLKEGQRTVDTWIRLRGGEIINKVTFPDDFQKKKNKKSNKKSKKNKS